MPDASAVLADAIRRSVSGPMWHGSSLRELLANVDHVHAAKRPVSNAHSIWELVLHIAVWTDVARRRVEGERVEPTDAEDWPRVEQTSKDAWARDLEQLQASHEALADVVSAFPADRLDAKLGGYEYTARTILHGVIEHDCYHGGQIGLLKKALQ